MSKREDIDFSDEYVAKAMKQDAEQNSIKYSSLGIEAFLPKRPTGAAPKPNTRFLRNILRDTDKHNATLLEKERREAKEREKRLDRKHEHGRLSPYQSGVEEKEERRSTRDIERNRKRRRDRSRDLVGEERYERKQRRRHQNERSKSPKRRGYRDREYERHSRRDQSSRRYHDSDDLDDNRRRHRSRKHHSTRNRSRSSSASHEQRRMNIDRRRNISRVSSSRVRSRSPRKREYKQNPPSSSGTLRIDEKNSRVENESDTQKASARLNEYHEESPNSDAENGLSKGRTSLSTPKLSASPSDSRDSSPYDSDPLEKILGPAPLTRSPTPSNSAQQAIKRKGRGSHNPSTLGSSTMDQHFSSTYDPSTDVTLQDFSRKSQHSADGDEWAKSLELYRERQKWKAQGAERLRSAGFSEGDIKRWENSGKEGMMGKDGDESEVVWSKKGEGREWDRGKVVGLDGEFIGIRVPWAKEGKGEKE